MKLKTSELTGAALDWAVAKCEGLDYWQPDIGPSQPEYSTDWSQGGPIIEKLGIELRRGYDDELVWTGWQAHRPGAHGVRRPATGTGDTALIAAMRAYVASKLGEEVEIPQELCE